MISPYQNNDKTLWPQITAALVNIHPLASEIKDVVLEAWDDIFSSTLGGYRIGRDIFPDPQIIGFFLHELIALKLEAKGNGQYRKGRQSNEKDVECDNNPDFSLEIKTSSNPSKIFANRSYAQPSVNGRKNKDGYYLAVNFDKIEPGTVPTVRMIRFGYLEHSDWIAQASATGQQAHLASETYNLKFVTLLDNR